MNNIALGKYIPGNTLIHKLDPRIKLMTMILMMVAIFINGGLVRWFIYLILFLLILLFLKISKLGIKMVLRTLKPMMFMMIFLFIINLFVYKEGTVLLEIPFINFKIYASAITQTVFIVVRLFLMLAVTTILTTTTKPLDMTYALEWYMSPLKVVHFPSHEIAMTISIALRFIPTILEETQRIIKAQSSRGVDLKEGKFSEKVKAIVSLLIPLFISAFQRSEELADAMEARGYDPSKKRVRYRVMKITKTDIFSLIFMIFVLVGIFVLKSFDSQIVNLGWKLIENIVPR